MIFDWMLASPSERRVLGARPLRGPTPWVIAIMTFSMMLVAAAGFALSNTASTVAKGVEARYSVQIPDGRRGFEPTLKAIRTSPGVASAEGVPEAEMRRLLGRWLGPAGASADLPVPALVTFDVRPGADLGAIERRVQAASPGARLIAHRESLGPLRQVIEGAAMAGAHAGAAARRRGCGSGRPRRSGSARHPPLHHRGDARHRRDRRADHPAVPAQDRGRCARGEPDGRSRCRESSWHCSRRARRLPES